jgi:hypothetical protein
MLREQGKNEAWLAMKIQHAHLDMKDVVLATIDDQQQLRIYTEVDMIEQGELPPT